VIIDAQGLVKSAALVTRLARGIKHGMDWQSAREPLASLFYNQRHSVPKQQHAVERTRELFALSLGYSKPQSQGDYAIAQHFLNHLNADAGRYAVFLHATTRDDKHWPEANWRELIGLLAASGIRIKLPWGAPHEEARAKRLAEGFDYVEVLPRMRPKPSYSGAGPPKYHFIWPNGSWVDWGLWDEPVGMPFCK